MKHAQIIDGKTIAKALHEEVAKQVKLMPQAPGLAVILVGEDPASQVYVRNKIKACEEAGIISYEHRMPADSTQKEVRHAIKNLNFNPDIHGILLQLPIPAHLDEDELLETIDPRKDVDGLNSKNIGRLVAGKPGMVPCTPQGAIRLIKSVRKDLSGLNAVVVGRSLLFGKPMGQILLAENCTVTQAHSRTQNLDQVCRNADILVVAVGQPKMVKADWIKPGAIVIDVGINRQEEGKLCGDVDYEAALEVAGAITPVPGGVGPMTIACLLQNTIYAAINPAS